MENAKINQLDKVEKLLYQFQESSPKLVEFIMAFLYQSNELEDLYQEIFKSRDLEQAEGVMLDTIGVLVGEFRNNRNDTDYRNAIKTRIGVNTSSGTIEDLIAVLKLLYGEDVEIIITRDGSASISLFLGIPEPEKDIKPLIQQAMAAGVELSGILYSNNRLPFIPIERGSIEIDSGVLPERGVDAPDTRIPPERI